MAQELIIASDHAGYPLKKELLPFLKQKGFQVKDVGSYSAESADYPDFAHPLAKAVSEGEYERGITICGTGNGISMTSNKYPRIRAALCWNKEISALARQHNDANICSLPARFLSVDEAIEIVEVFLETGFDGGRHQRRIEKIDPE